MVKVDDGAALLMKLQEVIDESRSLRMRLDKLQQYKEILEAEFKAMLERWHDAPSPASELQTRDELLSKPQGSGEQQPEPSLAI